MIATLLLACAGACGGGGDAPIVYTPVSTTIDGDLYTLTLGDVKMTVDASRGARIIELSLRGANVLVTRDEFTAYGATYWPSPQSSWCAAGGDCWPPPGPIDNQPYTVHVDASSIHFSSATASIATVADSAITVSKQLTAVPESGAIDVTYTLTNTSPTASVSLAPWQLARVASGGLTYFGQGSGPVTYAADSDPAFTLTEGAGDLWYASAPVNHNSKAYADGTGWLAQVTPDRLLYLQSFPDLQPAEAAPGESEIQVFTNGDYVEIEAQGPLTTLGPSEELTWTVRWKLRRVPGGTAVAPDSAALASLATAALAE